MTPYGAWSLLAIAMLVHGWAFYELGHAHARLESEAEYESD